MPIAVLLLVFLVGCGAAQEPFVEAEETYLDPIFISELPDPPEEINPALRTVLPVSKCEVEGLDTVEHTPPGVYMTEEMAIRAGRTKVYADELRGLYEVDLRTMERERMIYQKQLDLADREADRLRGLVKRSWWEKNKGWMALSIGLTVGAGLAIGMAAALDGVTDAVE